MDEWMTRFTQWLAADSSRRGFFRRLGAVAVTSAAIASGRSIATEAAGLGCCSGLDCAYMRSPGKCPGRYPYNRYNWICCSTTKQSTICHDCFDPRGRYGCTYSVVTSTAC